MAAGGATTAGGRAPSRRRPELSRSRILDAAAAIVERDGDAALTFRRLGAELGADPTATYRHFTDKDDLLLALGDRLLGESLQQTLAALPPDPTWRATLSVAATQVRNTLVRHPRIAAAVSVRVTHGEHEALGIELGLKALVAAGLPLEDAVEVQRAFADTVLAWSLFSATYAALPPEVQERDTDAWRDTYLTLPEAEFPTIWAARPHLAHFDDAFENALAFFLDGVQARIDRLAAGSASTSDAYDTAGIPLSPPNPHARPTSARRDR